MGALGRLNGYRGQALRTLFCGRCSRGFNCDLAENLLLAALAKRRYSILEFRGEISESIRGAAAHETGVGRFRASVGFPIAGAGEGLKDSIYPPHFLSSLSKR
jgi:hypothetical protein